MTFANKKARNVQKSENFHGNREMRRLGEPMSKYYLDATNKGSGRTPAYHAGERKKQRDAIAARRKQKMRHINMPRRNAIDGSESRVGIISQRNGQTPVSASDADVMDGEREEHAHSMRERELAILAAVAASRKRKRAPKCPQ